MITTIHTKIFSDRFIIDLSMMPLHGHIHFFTTRKQQGPTRIMTQIHILSILDSNQFLTKMLQTNVKQNINTDGDIMIKSMMLAYDYNY